MREKARVLSTTAYDSRRAPDLYDPERANRSKMRRVEPENKLAEGKHEEPTQTQRVLLVWAGPLSPRQATS